MVSAFKQAERGLRTKKASASGDEMFLRQASLRNILWSTITPHRGACFVSDYIADFPRYAKMSPFHNGDKGFGG